MKNDKAPSLVEEGAQPQVNPFEGFEKVYTDINSLGSIWAHKLCKTTVEDYPAVYDVAVDFAKRACTVKILPVLTDPKDPLRQTLFAGAKGNTCPDLNVDGEFVDVKNPIGVSKNAINNNVKKAYRQSNYVVIRISGEVNEWLLRLIARERFKKHSDLQTISYKISGVGYKVYKRAETLK